MNPKYLAPIGFTLLTFAASSALALGPSDPINAIVPENPDPLATTDEYYWQQPPDQVDQFLQALTQLQVELVLDESCSMAGGASPSVCPWYTGTYGNAVNDKLNQLKASLVGCFNASDGVLDRWASRVNFAVRPFSNGNYLAANFASSLTDLENAVMGMGLGGSTEMSAALRDAGAHISSYFNDGNTLQCRPSFVLLLSDGDPNGGGTTMDFEADAPGPPDNLFVGAGSPWCAASYMSGTINAGCGVTTAYQDMIPGVTGPQDIKTYTIGFGLSGSFTPANLINVANLGEGLYFHATNVRALDAAFNSIINNMVTRTRAANTAPTLQLDGLFAGNDAYSASFKPAAVGLWQGNLKRYCLLPDLLPNGNFDTANDDCFYTANPSDLTQVINNDDPVDVFTGNNSINSAIGGVGALLRTRVQINLAYPRNIRFYRFGGAAYAQFRPSIASTDDLHMHGIGRIHGINRLHGYTFDSNLSDNDGAFDDDVSGKDPDDRNPVAAAEWPLGDPQNAQPLLLRYEPGGAVPGPEFIFMAANDGMFHAFRASDGFEVSALIPAEVMAPHPAMNYSLRDLFAHFSTARRKAYLLDSSPRLFLDDTNGDLRIGPTEAAFVVVGAGRAGAAYFLIPVTTFNGTFMAGVNPVFTLRRQAGTHYRDMADAWSPPWLGQMRVSNTVDPDAVYRVAVFGSGHMRGYDGVTNLVAAPSPVQVPSNLEDEWNVSTVPTPVACASLPAVSAYCNYLWPVGYPDFAPLDVPVGPLVVPGAYAYRVVFTTVDIEPGDRIEVMAGDGTVADVLTGTYGGAVTTEWVYDDMISLRLATDGSGNGGGHQAFAIDRIEYLTAAASPTGTPPNLSHFWAPSLFVVDLNRWNGPSGSASGPNPSQALSPTVTDDGMLLRFTSNCYGNDVGSRCFDPTAGAAYDDLRYMRCSISSEISVLDVAGRVERAYFADECAQIWRLSQGATPGTWTVNRIIRLNSDLVASGVWPSTLASAQSSFSFRKIQTRVDLVRSRCTGVNSIQVVFATGDQQNPVNTTLLGPTGRNIFGVLWDDNTVDVSTSLANLVNASSVDSIDPRTLAPGIKGWYLTLADNEQVLRNPLVFGQTAYFKSFIPGTPSQCPDLTDPNAGSGIANFYAVDSCTSEAVFDANGNAVHEASERLASTDSSADIGMGPVLVASRDAVMVLGDNGSLNPRQVQMGRNRFLNWRLRP